MSVATIAEIFDWLWGLIRRFDHGDARAAQRLKDILPERTYTRMVREREKQLDKAKFG